MTHSFSNTLTILLFVTLLPTSGCAKRSLSDTSDHANHSQAEVLYNKGPAPLGSEQGAKSKSAADSSSRTGTIDKPDSSPTPSQTSRSLSLGTQSHSPKSLDDYIKVAMERSSELKAAYNRYQAALERNPQVSALPDPKFSYGYFINSVETRVGPQRHRLGVAQSFPWFGTLTLRGEQADAEAKAEFYRFLTHKNRLVFNVAKIYGELAYLDAAIASMKNNIKLVKSWEDVLQGRFRTNLGSHSDLVRIQVELGKLEDKIAELSELRRPTEAALNSVLNRTIDQAVSLEEGVLSTASLNQSAASAKSISSDTVLRFNPELSMFDALIEAGNHGIQLARKKYYPDLSVGLNYVITGDRDAVSDSGEDSILSTVSLSLPLNWKKYDAGFREANLKKESIESLKKNKEYYLQAEFARAKYRLRDSERRIVLYKNTLIPKTEESIETSFTAYQNAEARFLDVLDAQRQLLDFELALSKAKADRLISAISLFKLSGGYSQLASFDRED